MTFIIIEAWHNYFVGWVIILLSCVDKVCGAWYSLITLLDGRGTGSLKIQQDAGTETRVLPFPA